jgi:putative oxidoreductase
MHRWALSGWSETAIASESPSPCLSAPGYILVEMPQANAGPIQRMANLGLRAAAGLLFLAPLLTRLVVGFGFHATGHGKLQNLGKVTGFFTDLGIPFPAANATFIAYLEFIGGICLIIGLGTRLFAALLSCTMIVALLTADRQAFVEKFPTDVSDVTSFTFLVFLVWLVLYGPGPISIDWFLSKWLGLNKTVEPT